MNPALTALALLALASLPAEAAKPDTYSSFAELAAAEPARAYSILKRETGSPVTFLAIHAGWIETFTGELALLAAGTEHNSYLFVGRKTAGNRALHITSSRFDEPSALALVARSRTCVSIHGFIRGDGRKVCVGGLDQGLREAFAGAVRRRGIDVVLEMDCEGLAGRDPRNIVNRCGRGLQLELSRELREALRVEAGLRARFVAAMREAVGTGL